MNKNGLAVIREIFSSPAGFESQILEADFLRDYASKFAPHRRAAAVIGLLTWVLYVGWDLYHARQNDEFNQVLPEILFLRILGALALTVWLWLTFRDRFRDDERYATRALILGLVLAYGDLLAMMVVVPFPLNYLYYYIGLLLVMIFLFGFLRLRAMPVFSTTLFFLAASACTFPFAESSHPSMPDHSVSGYYVWAAMTYLISFAVVGCAIAVELERTARRAFAREKDLAALNRELVAAKEATESKTAALVAVTDDLRRRAEQENINKSKFLADAIHDLKQPVQALVNLMEAASWAFGRSDVKKCGELVEAAQEATQRIRGSFNAALELSRLESGFVEAEYSNFDLRALLGEVGASLRPLAEARGVKLRLSGQDRPRLVVRSDRDLLGRVLTNLVSNAIKYSDRAKSDRAVVVVGAVRLANRARLDVVDNGIGIPKQKWDVIFKPFVQLNNPERDREKGVGLGLSIVKAILTLLREHRVDMRSTEGRGTRFSVEIPASTDAEDADPASRLEPRPGRADLAGLYVLYVEDDALVRRSTAALFQEQGILFEAAGSVDELERILPGVERMPDMIVTDYRLQSEQTALDVVRLVRTKFDAEIPALVMSGEATELRDRSPEGAKVLRKPVPPTVLLDEIGVICRAQSRPAPE